MKIITIIFPVIFILSSCLLLNMNPPEVVDFSPDTNVIRNPDSVDVWISFSTPMDKIKTENAFFLYENEIAMRGEFSWNGRRLVFAPFQGFTAGGNYELKVNTDAEDIYGNSLINEFVFSFQIGNDDIKPEIVSITPMDNAQLGNQIEPVLITFSEPVRRPSFYDAFTIIPQTSGTFTWLSGDSQCVFTPFEGYQWQTEYEITVSTDLQDVSYNNLAKEMSSRFYIGTDNTPPAIDFAGTPDEAAALQEGIMTTGWEADWGIRIRFTEPVVYESFPPSIQIEPKWSYEIEWDTVNQNQAVLKPLERFTYNSVYTLRIKTGVEDLQGNTLAREAVYRFLVSGESSAPPEIRLANYVEHTIGFDPVFLPLTMYSNIVFNAGTMDRYIDVYIGHNLNSYIHLFSFIENFSHDITNNCLTFAEIKIEIVSDFYNPYEVNPLPAADETLVRVHFNGIDGPNSGLFSLEISGEFADSRGNVIDESWQVILNN